jgi:hypothetical protein
MTPHAKRKGPENAVAFRALPLLESLVRENYSGTTWTHSARRSEAASPMQQHAQVEVADTIQALSHAAARGVKRVSSRCARDQRC